MPVSSAYSLVPNNLVIKDGEKEKPQKNFGLVGSVSIKETPPIRFISLLREKDNPINIASKGSADNFKPANTPNLLTKSCQGK